MVLDKKKQRESTNVYISAQKVPHLHIVAISLQFSLSVIKL